MSFIELLQVSRAFFISFCSVIGLIAGSFLNVVIHRLPRMLECEWREQCAQLHGEIPASPLPEGPVYNLITPRSSCPHCGYGISALENIPLISYMALRGRCSHCHAFISMRYPIVEGLTGFLSGFIAWHFGYGAAAFTALIFAWAMVALTCIDLDTQLLPDDITIPLIWGGLLVNLYGVFTDIHSAVLGAVAGYMALWCVYWGYRLVTHREGMGYGDFKLLAAIGSWLGWQMLPLVILFSSIVGAVVGIGQMLIGKRGRHVPIPFGPYLAGGGLLAMFWGSEINRAYLELL